MSGKIILGCDSAAVELKNTLGRYLAERGYEVEDLGCGDCADPVNYPAVAERVCGRIISGGYADRGILVCGTGIGMSIVANKFQGIRAALCHDNYSAERAALSNNANVLCLGARVVGTELAKKIVGEWVELHYQDGPSTPKLREIDAIDAQNRRESE